MNKPPASELIFFWVLFGVTGVLAFFIFSPYIVSLFLALVLAIMFAPVHTWLYKRFHMRETLAALLSTLLVALFILTPLIFFGVLLFGEVADAYFGIINRPEGITVVDQYSQQFESFVRTYVPGFQLTIDADQYLGQALGWIAQNLNSFFSGLFGGILNFFIVLVALFFFFRDGDALRASLIRWSPLSDKRDESILERVSRAVGSVVKGSLLIAMLQGVLTGIGFFFAGVPNPVLWGAVAMFAALIPSVGTAIVSIPAVVYLFSIGQTVPSVLLLAWALAIVGTIDNFLRPILIERGIHMHPFVILLSVLGGLAFFGPIGFIAGPVLMSLFFALAEIYPNIMKGTAIPDGESHERA